MSNFVKSATTQTPNSPVTFETKVAQNLKMIHDTLRDFQREQFTFYGPPSQDEMSVAFLQQQAHLSVFGTAITKRNQMLVRIFEAKDLKTLLMQSRHTYCKILLKADDVVVFRGYTYLCDETNHPHWYSSLPAIQQPDDD